ncbi:hypothetical protein GGR57DRAFT_503221 [Xylariaceae sp. FL1272]|nr:hypothetical protein GGR57DRAFT_503221 [Xylariaceae sp. FL1272]
MLAPMGTFKRRLSQALPMRRDQRRQSRTLTSLSQPTTPTAEDDRDQADQMLGFQTDVSRDGARSTTERFTTQDSHPEDFMDPRSMNSQPYLSGPVRHEMTASTSSPCPSSVYSREWEHSTSPSSPCSIRILQPQNKYDRADTNIGTLRPQKVVPENGEDEPLGPGRSEDRSDSTDTASPKPQNQPLMHPLAKTIIFADANSEARASKFSLASERPMSISYLKWTVPSDLKQEHSSAQVDEPGDGNVLAGKEEYAESWWGANPERASVDAIQSQPASARNTPSPSAPNKTLRMRENDRIHNEDNLTSQSAFAEYHDEAEGNRGGPDREHPSQLFKSDCPLHHISANSCWLLGIVLLLVLLVLLLVAYQGDAMELSLVRVNVIVSIEPFE